MDTKPENSAIPDFSFKKEERLCSKKVIDKLFAEGKSFLAFPLKVVFISTSVSSGYPAKAAFTVSKKLFKKAVDRNRIKRLIREAWRLNKHLFYEKAEGMPIAVFFIFIGKEMPDYKLVDFAIIKAIKKINREILTRNEPNINGTNSEIA